MHVLHHWIHKKIFFLTVLNLTSRAIKKKSSWLCIFKIKDVIKLKKYQPIEFKHF
jgi:hypothetical protein